MTVLIAVFALCPRFESLEAVGEIFFYCSPLTDSWTAPRHPYLLDGIGEPPEGWVRKGPAAITRAWCLFELTNVFFVPHIIMSQLDSPRPRLRFAFGLGLVLVYTLARCVVCTALALLVA